MIRDGTIQIKNIYYMLSYAFSSLNKKTHKDVSKEEFDNIHDLFAEMLSKQIGFQIKSGLFRAYINTQSNIASVRGKININETIKNKIVKRKVINCVYDELSENNYLNQILKTTVMLLIHEKDVNQDRKDVLKKEMMFFSEISEIKPDCIKWSSLRFSKSNSSYRFLIYICQLIIEGMLISDEPGKYRLASFMDEKHMNVLYENFIREYYLKECPKIHVSHPEIKWAVDDEERTMLPAMQTDVTLSNGNECLIIDAKYYQSTLQSQYDSHTIHSNNLYQIFTYVKNKEVELQKIDHKVSGMLLYAATDEQIQPDNKYQMSGNRIEVKTLDLNKEWKDITKQLNGIVEEYFHYSSL